MNIYRTAIIKGVPQSFKSGEWIFENVGVHTSAKKINDRNKVTWSQWFYDKEGVCQTEANLDLPKSYSRAQIVAAFEKAAIKEKLAA